METVCEKHAHEKDTGNVKYVAITWSCKLFSLFSTDNQTIGIQELKKYKRKLVRLE